MLAMSCNCIPIAEWEDAAMTEHQGIYPRCPPHRWPWSQDFTSVQIAGRKVKRLVSVWFYGWAHHFILVAMATGTVSARSRAFTIDSTAVLYLVKCGDFRCALYASVSA